MSPSAAAKAALSHQQQTACRTAAMSVAKTTQDYVGLCSEALPYCFIFVILLVMMHFDTLTNIKANQAFLLSFALDLHVLNFTGILLAVGYR